MDALLALLGIGGISLTLVWLLFAAFNLLWAILSAVLATRRGRNAWNWFFLTSLYGIFGLLILACSKTLNTQGVKERDTLAKVLWLVFAIISTLTIVTVILISIENKKNEELTHRIMEGMQREEQIYRPNYDSDYFQQEYDEEDRYQWK